MADKINKRTKRITLCALFSAFGTLLLSLGTLIEVLDLSCAVLASFLIIITVIEYGSGYGLGVFFSVSLLSAIIMPGSATVIIILFAGYYPILKEKYEKLGRVLSYLLKFVTFNAAFAGVLAALYFLVTGYFEAIPPVWMICAAAVVGNIVFFIYDLALTRLISLYIFRIRKRINK